MELTQKKTKPEMRSLLKFSKEEVIRALTEYAHKYNAAWSKKLNVKIRFPDHDGTNTETTLVVDCEGTNPPITFINCWY